MLPIWIVGGLLLLCWLWVTPPILHIAWWLQDGKSGIDPAPPILVEDNRLFGAEFSPYTTSGLSYDTLREIVAFYRIYQLLPP